MSEPTHGGAVEHGHGGLDLNKKVGPWPLKVWVVAIGGVVVVSLYLRHRNATNAATVAGDAGAATAPTALDNTQPGAGNLAGSTPGYIDTTGNDTQLGGSATNSSWLTKAEAALTGAGADAYTVDQALQAYLTGQQLTPAQESLFNQAVSAVGPVPIPVPAIPGTGSAGAGNAGGDGGQGSGVAPPSSSLVQFVVDDLRDANLLLSRGVSASQIRYGGADPLASRGNDYAPATQYGAPDPTRPAVYVGLAQGNAPADATIVAGPDTAATGTAIDRYLASLSQQAQTQHTIVGPRLPTTGAGGKYQAGG